MEVEKLIQNYDGLLIDAYGVLVHDKGCYEGAAGIVNLLTTSKTPYLVVTNDASRSIASLYQRFQVLGLDIPEDRITSSGSMLKPYFELKNLQGKNAIVLGTKDSVEMAEIAGAVIVAPESEDSVDVIIMGDEIESNLLEHCEIILSRIINAYDAGRKIELIVPNSDVIYPKEKGFGFTAGAFANMIEGGLAVARPNCDWTFTSLGKPEAFLFENAIRILKSKNLLMVGDQILTDILGAKNNGLDSLLVCSGIAKYDSNHSIQPTYVCDSFSVNETAREC